MKMCENNTVMMVRRILMIGAMIFCVVISEIVSQIELRKALQRYQPTPAYQQEKYSIIYTDARNEIVRASAPERVEKHVPIKYATHNGGCYVSVYSWQADNAVAKVRDNTYLVGILFVEGGSTKVNGPCKPNLGKSDLENTAKSLFHTKRQTLWLDGSAKRWLESGIHVVQKSQEDAR